MLGNDSCLSPSPPTGRPQTGCHQALPLMHTPQTCGFQLDKDGRQDTWEYILGDKA